MRRGNGLALAGCLPLLCGEPIGQLAYITPHCALLRGVQPSAVGPNLKVQAFIDVLVGIGVEESQGSLPCSGRFHGSCPAVVANRIARKWPQPSILQERQRTLTQTLWMPNRLQKRAFVNIHGRARKRPQVANLGDIKSMSFKS